MRGMPNGKCEKSGHRGIWSVVKPKQHVKKIRECDSDAYKRCAKRDQAAEEYAGAHGCTGDLSGLE